MSKYFKLFWILFFLDGLTPVFVMASYLGPNISFLFKITKISLFVLTVVFHFNNKFLFNSLSRVFVFAAILTSLVGLININSWDEKIFSQMYSLLMPPLAISFGQHYFRENGTKLNPFIIKIFKFYIPLNILLLFAYYFLHYSTGEIEYFGFQVGWQYISAYLAHTGRLLFFLIGIILVVLSGKRATLVTSILPFFAFIKLDNFKSKPFSYISIVIIVSLIGSYTITSLSNDGYFRRFEDTLNFDITNANATYVATSGRWQEVESATRHMNNKPYSWFVGTGIGDKYLFEAKNVVFDVKSEYKHYLHFTPMSYVFLFGLPLTLIIYFILFQKLIVGWWYYLSDFFYLCFLVSIIGGFFGANFTVDPVLWVFTGIVISLIKNKNVRN